MVAEHTEEDNAFILKQRGKFVEAMQAYARRHAKACEEKNEHIAQLCFDQMLDVQLLQLLKSGTRFKNATDLKHTASIYLASVLRELGAFDDSIRKYFDRSWAKFPSQKEGHPLFSAGREQLVHSRSNSESAERDV